MKRLKLFKAFNNHEEVFPSEAFGKATGMDWIYKEWKLPLEADEAGYKIGKWSDELESKKLQKKAADNLMKFLRALLDLNPELAELGEPKSWDNVIDFCRGAISKFNLNDIKFYSSLGWDDRLQYNRKNRPLMDQFEKKFGVPTGWVMSPTTIKRAKKNLIK
jgi:hypothetical protein